MMTITIEWLIAMLCGAVLSCWTAYQSSIVQTIKKALWLTPTERKTKYVWWFKPVVFVWQELQDLLDCPYCTGWHVGWTINYFYFGEDIITAMLYGTIVIVFVELYRKLTL